jgi:ABC-type microcin C transport system permease subunit YejE
MQLECPQCACKLADFDTERTRRCPICGLLFTPERAPIRPEPAPIPKVLDRSIEISIRSPIGVFRWLMLLFGPAITIIAALAGSYQFRLAGYFGFAVTLVTSALIARRAKTVDGAVKQMVILIVGSTLLTAGILYGGLWLLVASRF